MVALARLAADLRKPLATGFKAPRYADDKTPIGSDRVELGASERRGAGAGDRVPGETRSGEIRPVTPSRSGGTSEFVRQSSEARRSEQPFEPAVSADGHGPVFAAAGVANTGPPR